MRVVVFGLFLSMAVLLPKSGNAQVYQFRTPPPAMTAAASDWQINSDPIVVNGLVYYATRGFRFFDGQVMMQVGIVDRVPVYGDATLEPYSVVYVPIGRDRLREYERRREGELAGTTGSRVPAYPVLSPSSQALREASAPPTIVATSGILESGPLAAAPAPPAAAPAAQSIPASPGAPGSTDGSPSVGTAGNADRGLTRRTLVQTEPRPSGANGVWLEFNGSRYYSDGPATTFSPDRFVPVGDYRGFAVYRDKGDGKDAIWISVVKNGPLAPYVRR
jgi:hypothetical protein